MKLYILTGAIKDQASGNTCLMEIFTAGERNNFDYEKLVQLYDKLPEASQNAARLKIQEHLTDTEIQKVRQYLSGRTISFEDGFSLSFPENIKELRDVALHIPVPMASIQRKERLPDSNHFLYDFAGEVDNELGFPLYAYISVPQGEVKPKK